MTIRNFNWRHSVAVFSLSAFGMHVIVWGIEASRAQAVQDGYQAAASREVFFAESDILTLRLRLNESTSSIIQADDLARM